MADCPNLSGCGFIAKHGEDDIAVKGMILMYCKGAKQNECKRKTYKAEHGVPPSDDMLPNGFMKKAK